MIKTGPSRWLFLVAAIADPAQAGYLAHAVGSEATLPLPKSVAALDPRYLVDLQWSYGGGSSDVVVLPVRDATGDDSDAEGPPVEAIRGLLVDVLRQSRRFVVRASPNWPPSRNDGVGREPPDHVLRVSVAEYRMEQRGSVAIPRARIRASARQPGRTTLRWKLEDAATGDDVFVDDFTTVVAEPRRDFNPGTLARRGEFLGTAVGQAVVAAVNIGVYELAKALGPVPISGSVARAEDGRVWINLGRDSVAVGDMLRVTTIGEALVDPETGLTLGELEKLVGRIRVFEVHDKYSVAESVEVDAAVALGDRVVSDAAGSEFEFASSWDPPPPEDF